MKYAIGDVARILGMTPAGLHFFEKEGVIAPRMGSGTHRTYTAEDIIRLISYKKYRSMQLPLKEIAFQFSPSGESSAGIAQKLKAQQEEALSQARRCQQLACDIAWFEEAIRRVEQNAGQLDLAMMPACCALIVGTDGLISPLREQQRAVAAWLEHMPSARLSVFALPDGSSTFGYSMQPERAHELGLDVFPDVQSVPASVALHLCCKLPWTYFENPGMAFERLTSERLRRGFRQNGMGVGVNLCVECQDTLRDILCEVWLPVC